MQKFYWFAKNIIDSIQVLKKDLINESNVHQQWKKVDKNYNINNKKILKH